MPVVVDWSVGSMRRMFTVEKVVVVMMGCLLVFSHWLRTIYVLAQDGYVASPAPGLWMGGALALGLQDPVKQAGHWPSSLLQVLVELTELSHSAEQVTNTPSLLTCQLHHSVELRNKHTLFSSSCRRLLSHDRSYQRSVQLGAARIERIFAFHCPTSEMFFYVNMLDGVFD